MVDYSSLIGTSIYILCFKWLEEPLHLISFLFDQVSVDKITTVLLLTRAKVSMICAPSFTKMEMGMQMDFSSGSNTNIGVIISGGKDIDTFL